MKEWNSFIFQYAVGGIIFILGLVATWRGGDHSWKRREDRVLLIYVWVILLVYFAGQLIWQLYGLGYI